MHMDNIWDNPISNFFIFFSGRHCPQQILQTETPKQQATTFRQDLCFMGIFTEAPLQEYTVSQAASHSVDSGHSDHSKI